MVCNRCGAGVTGSRCLKCGGSAVVPAPAAPAEPGPHAQEAPAPEGRRRQTITADTPPPAAPEIRDPARMSTAEKIEFTQERILNLGRQVSGSRAALDGALGVLSATVRAQQTALGAAHEAAVRELESHRARARAGLEKTAQATLEKLTKEQAAQRVRAANAVKQAGLTLRDIADGLATRRPATATDRFTEADLVPATEVRDLLTLGTLQYGAAKTLDRDLPEVQALVPFVDRGHVIIESPFGAAEAPDPALKGVLTSVVAQAYASAPAGQIVVTVFNPKSSKALAAYLPTGATTAGLLRILQPTREAFERSLEEHLDFMVAAEASIGSHASMAALVEATGQHEHQYHALVILDGPVDWSAKSYGLLEKLMSAGAKAGISVVLHRDPTAAVPDRLDIDRLYQHASVLRRAGDQWRLTVKGAAAPIPVSPVAGASETAQARLMSLVVKGAESGSLPNIPFAELIETTTDTTEHGVKISMGRKGTQTTQFVLGDTISNIQNVLIGGRAGSGKTNLLKVMIYSMAARYPREELELFLLDFKEGGDFIPFAGGDGHQALPNASVVSRDCDPAFGIATLRHFEQEMNRRSNVTTDNGVANIWDLRAKTGIVVPRWVLIVDEFQGLFSGATYQEATETLENLVRKGRSFGLHVILATQTLSGVKFAGDKDRAIFENIAGRIALQLGPGEFTKFMQSGNDDGEQLRYRGQAIFNPAGGAKSDNQLFVVARADPDYTTSLQDRLQEAAVARGGGSVPFLYRGGERVSVGQLAERQGRPRENEGSLPAWLGRESTIAAEVATTSFEPITGSHVLLLGGDERTMPSAIATLQAAVLSAAAAADTDVDVLVLDALIPRFRKNALIPEWLATVAELGARVVQYDADTAAEFLQAVAAANAGRRRTIVAMLGAENSDLQRIADEDGLWRRLIREMPRNNVSVIGHWTDLRDVPGDPYALKDDYKTMLFFGKNEQLVVDATKRSRYDLPPLHESRTVVFSAARSQDGVTTVASISALEPSDLEAFRSFRRREAKSVERGGASASPPQVLPVATTTASGGPAESARSVVEPSAAAAPARSPEPTPPAAFADVIVRASASTVQGVTCILGVGAEGPVELTLGGTGSGHALIAGRAGTGLPALVMSALHSLMARHAASDIRLDLIDSIEGGDLPEEAFAALPHVGSVTQTADPDAVRQALSLVSGQLERRAALFMSQGVQNYEQYRAVTGHALTRQVVVFNEYSEVIDGELAATLDAIAERGPALGVHLVLTVLGPTDRVPDADLMPVFAARSARVLTWMPPDESDEFLGHDAAAGLRRGQQALVAPGVGAPATVFSVPDLADEQLASLRDALVEGA